MRLTGRLASSFGVLEPIAFAVGFDDGATVGEPVECGPGESFVAEDFGPVFEAEVGGEDDTGPFVGGGDDVEEEFGSGLAGGDVTQFVQKQQVEFVELAA